MPKNLPINDFLSIREAANFLGVSLDTIRRWDRKGKLTAKRVSGDRYFKLADLEQLRAKKPLSITEAAEVLKISPTTLRRLDK